MKISFIQIELKEQIFKSKLEEFMVREETSVTMEYLIAWIDVFPMKMIPMVWKISFITRVIRSEWAIIFTLRKKSLIISLLWHSIFMILV